MYTVGVECTVHTFAENCSLLAVFFWAILGTVILKETLTLKPTQYPYFLAIFQLCISRVHIFLSSAIDHPTFE